MRILLHSHFPAGHAYPMQAVAQALVDRGHETVWLTSTDNESRVKATGAAFVATKAIAVVDGPLIKESATGILDREFRRHESRLLAQVADYRSVLKQFHADVLLVDVFPHDARALCELEEVPIFATLGVIPLYGSTSKTPLPVSGKCPPTSWWGLLINELWQVINQWVLLPLFLRPIINLQRKALGLNDIAYGEPAESFNYSPFLHIQASSPTLEFRQVPKPHSQRIAYVGPLVRPLNITSAQLPPWWEEVILHNQVIGITQGTFTMDPTSLIIPSVQALMDDSTVLLIVISPYSKEIKSQIGDAPNIRYAEWLPYHLLLPQLCLLITNGGYGSVTQALSHGIPLLCAGQTEDKKDTAARVTWSGAGIDLKTDSPTKSQVKIATQRILENPEYRRNARLLGDELNSLGGAQKTCDLLEELAASAKARPHDQ